VGPRGRYQRDAETAGYRLRNKLETESGAASIIETIPNAGYVLNTKKG
jgi:DNA-binding response OmpR family regulator